MIFFIRSIENKLSEEESNIKGLNGVNSTITMIEDFQLDSLNK